MAQPYCNEVQTPWVSNKANTTYLPTGTIFISNGMASSEPSTTSSYTESTTQIAISNVPSSSVETSIARVKTSSSLPSSLLTSIISKF